VPALTILSFVAAIGCGLIAGTFFAFSVFVMRALASISAPAGIAAMQAINIVVINPLFLGVFLGTAVLCVIVSFLAFAGADGAGPAYIWIASLAYLVGTFGVTMLFNVPANNLLAKADPATADGEKLWRIYVVQWTRWNHIRAIAALLAMAAFILGIVRKIV
jgi:uncharacterized membrane protein